MEMALKQYVAVSERTRADIRQEVGVSRQCFDHWLQRDNPVYVEINPRNFEYIVHCYRREDIYVSATAMKRGPRFKRQVKK